MASPCPKSLRPSAFPQVGSPLASPLASPAPLAFVPDQSIRQALFEICELAQSVIHGAASEGDKIPRLFAVAEEIKDEMIKQGGVSGTPCSKDYVKASKWLYKAVQKS